MSLRKRLPDTTSAEVLFLSDHTCCICNERGKAVQIHHVNEDPSGNRLENLAVLCLEDHNRTQIRGGFGKHLLAAEVIKYRDAWHENVARLYRLADRGDAGVRATGEDLEQLPTSLLVPYIASLPTLRGALYQAAHRGWDTGVTSSMNNSSNELIVALEEVWVYLARFYPKWHFDRLSRSQYIRAFVAERYLYHRSIHQPAGEGSAGTMVGQLSAGGVLRDIENAIGDMVEALWIWHQLEEIDFPVWRKLWSGTVSGPE